MQQNMDIRKEVMLHLIWSIVIGFNHVIQYDTLILKMIDMVMLI